MAGRKQFDEEAALEAAMRVFWSAGYEATSLADLEAATGLAKSSLYNAYGSKEGLYVLALQRFSARYSQELTERLAAPGLAEAVEGFFAGLLARLADPEVPLGCMATMAAMETGAGVRGSQVRAGLEAMEEAFLARCRRAAAEGELRPGWAPEPLAAMLLAMTRGVAVLNAGYGDTRAAEAAVEGLMTTVRAATHGEARRVV
ncbi:MAG: TetR/AcrR family transcriptional regulator [Pseudomonadota bacterium]